MAQKHVIFGDLSVPVPTDTTPDEARSVLKESHPEIENATYDVQRNGDIYFSVQAGEKG